MMDDELGTWMLLEGATHAGQNEIVDRHPDGSVSRHGYGAFLDRTRRLMAALDGLRLGPGERVATLAWNSSRHLEAYFAVPCTGRVLHTLNVRLSPEELAFVVNDADDRAILVDPDFVPLLAQVLPSTPGVRHVVVLDDATAGLDGAVAYEELLAAAPGGYERRQIDERSPAGLCYTSGTTGRSKGVVYSHRSTFLHALACSSMAGLAIGPSDVVLPQVPMFHANAWGMPYAAVAVGASLVFYAGAFAADAFADLLLGERVTVTGAVPTVWIGLADALHERPRPEHLRHIVCGGSQPPRALIERYARDFGVPIIQAWGMTETSPLASMAWPQAWMRDLGDDEVTDRARCQAGLPLPGVAVRIRDDAGAEVAFDGASMGALQVRGPWVTDGYLHGAGPEAFTDDGWFDTGDVAIGSPDGYFVIADRTKDLIKSGGEWISSVDMEAAIMAMPGVVEAAVVAIPDAKWVERPLACVVARPGVDVSREEVRAHLEAAGFASWQVPDRVEVIDEVPKTAVGKFDKKVLRSRFSS
ncbi:MAG TPA: long-chain fatty acid--CoA ligase [Acidimicrobiales bacterium]|nr:long-chain fatty acid--CoA ligase [Acidimicrobiales bacterium]